MSARQAKLRRKTSNIRLTTLREAAARICRGCRAGHPLDRATWLHTYPGDGRPMEIGCTAHVIQRMIADEESL